VEDQHADADTPNHFAGGDTKHWQTIRCRKTAVTGGGVAITGSFHMIFILF
jgi:hypothetical protein